MPTVGPEGVAEQTQRLQRLLHTRGVLGMVMLSLYQARLALADWPGCAVVLMPQVGLIGGTVLPTYPHDMIRPDANSGWNQALAGLRAQGCRKIGFATTQWQDTADNRVASSRAWLERGLRPEETATPLILCEGQTKVARMAEFKAWWERERPDGMIFTFHEILDWLAAIGVRVPEDVNLAHLGTNWEVTPCAGIDLQPENQARAAMDVLIGRVLQNERGAPRFPKTVLVPVRWKDGPTARPRGGAAGK